MEFYSVVQWNCTNLKLIMADVLEFIAMLDFFHMWILRTWGALRITKDRWTWQIRIFVNDKCILVIWLARSRQSLFLMLCIGITSKWEDNFCLLTVEQYCLLYFDNHLMQVIVVLPCCFCRLFIPIHKSVYLFFSFLIITLQIYRWCGEEWICQSLCMLLLYIYQHSSMCY